MHYVLLLCVPLLAACAAVRSPPAASSDYVRDVGVATALDIATWTTRLLDDWQYVIIRRDGPPEIYFETSWRAREPFLDERERGVTAAEERILVRGRRRPPIGTAHDLFTVRLTVESRVMLVGREDWHQIPATPMFVKHASELARQLELRFDSGVRRY
jgi:hypothetical protein